MKPSLLMRVRYFLRGFRRGVATTFVPDAALAVARTYAETHARLMCENKEYASLATASDAFSQNRASLMLEIEMDSPTISEGGGQYL